MTALLHLIDRDTPLEMRDQLALLAGGDDRIVSVGPMPPAEDRLAAQPVHAPLGSARACAKRLARQLGPIEMIHAWSARAARAGEFLARRRNVPVILSLPGVPADDRFLQKSAAIITVPTQASLDILVERGIDASRIALLPPAARPPANPAKGRRAIREQLGLADDELLMAAPGALIRPMQHKVACWAHAMLRYVDPKIRLVLPDDGVDRPFVYSFARGAGFVDETYGPFPPSRREEVLAAADVALIVPSGDMGTGVLAECLAAGVPTAAFGLPSLIDCGGRAVQFAEATTPRAAAQATLALLESADLARSLTDTGRQLATERFNVDLIRRTLRDIYAATEGSVEAGR